MKIDLFLNTDTDYAVTHNAVQVTKGGEPVTHGGIGQYSNMIKADLYPNEGIDLKRKLFGENGLENTNANFTKDFLLPATDRNNKALGHYEVKSNKNVHNPAKKIPARVDVGGALSILGNCELFSITYKDNKPESYKIVFYSDVSSLKSEIGNDLLEDIELDTNFGFTWSGTSVADSWAETLASGNVYIPVLSWQRWYKWFEVANGDPTDIAVEATGITLDELRVGLGVKKLLETILSEYGYNLTFSPKVDAAFTNAYTFPIKKIDKAAIYEAYQIRVANDQDLSITTTDSIIELASEIRDPSDLWTSDSIYTAAFGGDYVFNFKYTINVVSGSGVDVVLYVIDNATDAVLDTVFIASGSTSTSGTVQLTPTLAVGQTFRLEWVDNDGNNAYTASFAELESVTIPLSPIGKDFIPSEIIPEIRVADFLSGFLKTYNLVLARTGTASYQIYDYEDLYNSTTVLNLSKYTNNKTLTYNKMGVYSTVNLLYKEGKDAPNVAYDELQGRQYGEYFFRPDVDYSNGEFKRESIFSVFPPGYMASYNASGIATGTTDLQHHFQLTDDTPPKLAEADFVIMYKNATINTEFPYWLETGVGTKEEQSTYSQYSQVRDDESTADSYTLAYSLENPFVGIAAGKTAFANFYEDWFDAIYDNTAFKVMVTFPAELNLYMKIKDLAVVFLNGYYHNIMEYSYKTEKQELTLMLMKIPYAAYEGVVYPGDYLQSDYNDDYLK